MIPPYFPLLPHFFLIGVYVPLLYLFFSFLFFSSLVSAWDLVFVPLNFANWWGSFFFFTLQPFPSFFICTPCNLYAEQERKTVLLFTSLVYLLYSRSVQYGTV